jgi:PPOX class probable F420-dependent enzyme
MTSMPTGNLHQAVALGQAERGLAIVSTLRADLSIQSTLVNAGLLDHPQTGRSTVAFVTAGPVKRAHLRARPQITVTFRSGWQWASIEGRAVLAGPDDPQPWLNPTALPSLLRAIFVAAGGQHDDWDEFDAVMVRERRLAVLVDPLRIYSNPGAPADANGQEPSSPPKPTKDERESQ